MLPPHPHPNLVIIYVYMNKILLGYYYFRVHIYKFIAFILSAASWAKFVAVDSHLVFVLLIYWVSFVQFLGILT